MNSDPFIYRIMNSDPFTYRIMNSDPFIYRIMNSDPFTYRIMNSDPFIYRIMNSDPFTYRIMNSDPFIYRIMNSDPFIYRIPGRNYWIYWIDWTYSFDGKKRNGHFAIDGDIQCIWHVCLVIIYIHTYIQTYILSVLLQGETSGLSRNLRFPWIPETSGNVLLRAKQRDPDRVPTKILDFRGFDSSQGAEFPWSFCETRDIVLYSVIVYVYVSCIYMYIVLYIIYPGDSPESLHSRQVLHSLEEPKVREKQQCH